MSKNTTDTGRESGTGQDTPTVCVHVPPRFPLRRAGHSVTMSRPVPLSRIVARRLYQPLAYSRASRPPPGRCGSCERAETPSAVVVPFGTAAGTQATGGLRALPGGRPYFEINPMKEDETRLDDRFHESCQLS